jgi:ABC-type amino acid transport substrate-binding protein
MNINILSKLRLVLLWLIIYCATFLNTFVEGTNATERYNQTTTTRVTIYTKTLELFSNADQNGYSIDFARELLGDIYGKTAEIYVVTLASNDEIIQRVLDHENTVNHYAIGTAGISITPEREKLIDFLPAFFESGLQIMIRSTVRYELYLRTTFVNFIKAFGPMLGVILLIIAIFTPLAYFFEFAGTEKNKIAIFIDHNHRKKMKHYGTTRLMLFDLWNALKWVSYSVFGTDTGSSNSTGGRLIHKILKFVSPLVFIVATASMTAVLAKSNEVTQVDDYEDLRGQVVCTMKDSIAETFLSQRNIGLLRKDTTSDMFETFWDDDDACFAVVFDYPILQNEVVKHNGDGRIMGQVFSKEDYGIVVSPNNPNFELLKQGVIALKNDPKRMKYMEEKWFADLDKDEYKTDVIVPPLVIIVPCIIGFVLLSVIMVYLYKNYNKYADKFDQIRRDNFDRDYKNDYRKTLQDESSSEDIFLGSSGAIEEILFNSRRSLRLLYEHMLAKEGVDISELGRSIVPTPKTRRVVTPLTIRQRHAIGKIEEMDEDTHQNSYSEYDKESRDIRLKTILIHRDTETKTNHSVLLPQNKQEKEPKKKRRRSLTNLTNTNVQIHHHRDEN